MCCSFSVGGVSCGHTLPLGDVNSHAEHLLLVVLLAVAQSTPEEEEAGAVGLTLAHKHRQVNTCGNPH